MKQLKPLDWKIFLAYYYQYNNIADFQTDLNSAGNLCEENIPIAKYIVVIPVDIEGKLPECYLDNGAMIIFNQSNSAGWNVGKIQYCALDSRKRRLARQI